MKRKQFEIFKKAWFRTGAPIDGYSKRITAFQLVVRGERVRRLISAVVTSLVALSTCTVMFE